MTHRLRSILLFCLPSLLLASGVGEMRAESPWKRHVIDATSEGADGVRLADFNGDGLPDVVTGWEEGRQTRLCLHPGHEKVREPWPSVKVGAAPSVEDAVSIHFEHGKPPSAIVSACEGGERALRFHWTPPSGQWLDEEAWRTEVLPGSVGMMGWMQVLPVAWSGGALDGFIVGGKGENAAIGWWQAAGEDKSDLSAWTWHPFHRTTWVMGIALRDLNGDGRQDVLYTEQNGPERGIYWLEHPAEGPKGEWTRHPLGLQNLENDPATRSKRGREATVCFFEFADLDGDGLEDILVAADRQIVVLRRLNDQAPTFESHSIPFPAEFSGAKSVAAADMNGNGRLELVFSTLTASAGQPLGVGMIEGEDLLRGPWTFVDIGGSEGRKFDNVLLVDLTGNGLPDILTCEERDNLGVVWYENPGPTTVATSPLTSTKQSSVLLP